MCAMPVRKEAELPLTGFDKETLKFFYETMVNIRIFELTVEKYFFEGEIPGSKEEECGNYLLHDLPLAKEIANDMLSVLDDWSVEKMAYSS